MSEGNQGDRRRELFERKWSLQQMEPNRSLIRLQTIRKIVMDVIIYAVFIGSVLWYTFYTHIIYVVYPFLIAVFIAVGAIVFILYIYTGLDPFAIARRKFRETKRLLRKK